MVTFCSSSPSCSSLYFSSFRLLLLLHSLLPYPLPLFSEPKLEVLIFRELKHSRCLHFCHPFSLSPIRSPSLVIPPLPHPFPLLFFYTLFNLSFIHFYFLSFLQFPTSPFFLIVISNLRNPISFVLHIPLFSRSKCLNFPPILDIIYLLSLILHLSPPFLHSVCFLSTFPNILQSLIHRLSFFTSIPSVPVFLPVSYPSVSFVLFIYSSHYSNIF